MYTTVYFGAAVRQGQTGHAAAWPHFMCRGGKQGTRREKSASLSSPLVRVLLPTAFPHARQAPFANLGLHMQKELKRKREVGLGREQL